MSGRKALRGLVHHEQARVRDSARPIASICCSPPESCAPPLRLRSASVGRARRRARVHRSPVCPGRARRRCGGARRRSARERAGDPGDVADPAPCNLVRLPPTSSWPSKRTEPLGVRRRDAHDRVAERRLAHPVATDDRDRPRPMVKLTPSSTGAAIEGVEARRPRAARVGATAT